MLVYSNRIFFGLFLLLTILLVIQAGDAKGQDCTVKKRTYANFQARYEAGVYLALVTLTGKVTNGGNAIDNNNLKNYSSLNVGVGVGGLMSATQFLQFTTDGTTPRTLPIGKPVTIKFSLPKSVLGLIDGVEIGTYSGLKSVNATLTNTAGHTANNFYPAFSSASLLNLLSGSGDAEVTIVPTQPYNGTYIKLSGNGLSVALTANVYHSYITEDEPAGSYSCASPIDVLSGSRAGTNVGGIANGLADVNAPWNAIDGDLTSYAELDVTAQILNETFLTTIFNTTSQPGDAVQIFLQKAGGGLLDLSLLNGFSIQLYNGSTPVGTVISSSSGLLSLSLLTTGQGQFSVVTVRTSTSTPPFDRIEIKLGGLANVNLTSKLKIYEVKKIILPQPTIDGVTANSKTICEGSTTSLSINEFQDCTTYKWYTASSGGTDVHSGSTPYTPQASLLTPGVQTFYVEASRTNCTETSGRIPVTITVNPRPSITPENASVCLGVTNCNVPYTNMLESPTTYSITWNPAALAAGLTNVPETTIPPSQLNVVVPAAIIPGNYTGGITVKNANCSSPPIDFTITVNPKPVAPHVLINTNSQY